jgi:general secretion pathway protein E
MSRPEDKNSRLLDVLLEVDKITRDDVEKIIQLQEKTHEKADRILLNLGIISEEDLRDALGNLFNLKTWQRKKEEELPVVDCLPQNFLHSNRILPLKQHNGNLDIAVTDPSDESLLEVIESTTNKRVNIFIGCEKDIIASLNETYEDTTKEDKSAYSIDLDVVDDIEKLKDLALEAPVVRLVNNALNKALEIGASDIHIEMFENKPKLRYRIDGVLIDYPPPTRDVYFATINRIKIMSNLNIAEKRLPQDGRIRLKVGGKEIDIRVSVIPMLYGECIVMRILDKSNITLDLSTFGFSEDVLENLRKLITKSEGMILATGPTGSGKTTTLYASLKEIISPSLKIITVEDPVEYSLEGVNQIQVNSKVGLDFASGLRSILRHDPDVILVGEIRDKSTASISIQSSLTGHLVLSTLHTNDAASAFNRLLDMGMEDYLVSTCVIAVLAQRLVRKLCECKEEYRLDEETMARIGIDSEKPLYRPNGCIECSNTGYRGRVAISELLIVNDNIRQMIVNRERSNILQREAMRSGMRTLWQDGLKKVEDGFTSLSELERVTDDTSVKAGEEVSDQTEQADTKTN